MVCFSVVWTLRRASEVISVMTLRPSASNTLSDRKYSLVDCSSETIVTSSSIKPFAAKLSLTLSLISLRERVAVFVQLLERLGGGEAAQRADDLCFEQVADLVGIERLFAERATRGQNRVFGMSDVGIKFSVHVDADVVGRQNCLFASPADGKFYRSSETQLIS